MSEKQYLSLMFEYDGLFRKLCDYICGKVNDSISMQIRERLGVNLYVSLHVKKETELIQSEDWLSVLKMFEIDYPTESDKEAIKQMETSDLLDIHQILIQASKQAIDSHEENTELAQKIHAYYLLTHSELEQRIPNYLRGDGFEDYLTSRENREGKNKLLEETRITGSVCPYCESTNVKKDGNAFRCKSCGRYWRKKGYKPKTW